MVAGQTQFLGDDSCSGVVDPLAGSGELVWETCDYSLGFSPDGRLHDRAGRLLGRAGLAERPDPRRRYRRAGRRLPAPHRPGRRCAAVGEAVWEDDDTVIAKVEQDGKQSIVRAEFDGVLSRVTPSLPTSDLSIEYRFPNHTASCEPTR